MVPLQLIRLASLTLLSMPLTSATAAEAWRTAGFNVPESVAYDPDGNRLIVSNIVGDATQADGNGTLSLLGTDGMMIEADWVTGLDAPKGSAVSGGKLYVADLTNLRIVDLASGEVETLAVAGAVFLNDVAAGPDGAIYLSDTFGNAIYRFAGGEVEQFVQDPALQSPNGLWVDGGKLLVASLGAMSDNPEESKPGGIVTVDLATKAISKDEAAGDFGFLDGIVKVGGAFYVTDFMTGTIFRYMPDSAPEAFATLRFGTADLGTDGQSLYVPQMMEGEVVKLTTE